MDAVDFDHDPLQQLRAWLESARNAGAPMPEAMAVATATPDGHPSVRMLILRGLSDGLTFFTDGESDKASELGVNPVAAAVFHWLIPFNRQVRVTGSVSMASLESADRYWESRPDEVRYTAAASHQSHVVTSRESLESQLTEVQQRHPEASSIPRPDRWRGYLITPTLVEFWEERPDRLHDRFRYGRVGESWEIERLSP